MCGLFSGFAITASAHDNKIYDPDNADEYESGDHVAAWGTVEDGIPVVRVRAIFTRPPLQTIVRNRLIEVTSNYWHLEYPPGDPDDVNKMPVFVPAGYEEGTWEVLLMNYNYEVLDSVSGAIEE